MRDAFGRIGGLSPEMLPIRGSESVDGYRNKLQMPLSRQDGERSAASSLSGATG